MTFVLAEAVEKGEGLRYDGFDAVYGSPPRPAAPSPEDAGEPLILAEVVAEDAITDDDAFYYISSAAEPVPSPPLSIVPEDQVIFEGGGR